MGLVNYFLEFFKGEDPKDKSPIQAFSCAEENRMFIKGLTRRLKYQPRRKIDVVNLVYLNNLEETIMRDGVGREVIYIRKDVIRELKEYFNQENDRLALAV